MLCHLVFNQRNTRHKNDGIITIIKDCRRRKTNTRWFGINSGFNIYCVSLTFSFCADITVASWDCDFFFLHIIINF